MSAPVLAKVLLVGFLLAVGAFATASLGFVLAVVVVVLATSAIAFLMVKRIRGLAIITAGALLGGYVSFNRSAQQAAIERQQQAQRDTAAKRRESQLARIPGLMNDVRSGLQDERWEQAATAYHEIKKIHPERAKELGEEWSKIEPEWLRIHARLNAQRHRTQIDDAIKEATAVVKDNSLCDKPKAIKEAWDKLRVATKDDERFAEAQALASRLEHCRRSSERYLSREFQAVMMSQRDRIGEQIDRIFLDNNLDVRIAVRGKNKDFITLTHVFFGNRATVET